MPCVKSGARAGSLYRNLVAHALTLGASGDRAPVRQQPCLNGHIIGFGLQTQKLESPYKTPSSTLVVKGLRIMIVVDLMLSSAGHLSMSF